mmetsp:Transcript_27537/g.36102  ORF Transcript_27537/g.36102 Transcript_27537/m.36102 type:complete len:518 (+) Transcript_27537:197-1750(+)
MSHSIQTMVSAAPWRDIDSGLESILISSQKFLELFIGPVHISIQETILLIKITMVFTLAILVTGLGRALIHRVVSLAKRKPVDEWMIKLKAGDVVDANFCNREWLESVILHINGNKAKIHYNGQPSQMDTFLDINCQNIQPLHTKTSNWRNFKVGDEIEVREEENQSTEQWHSATVLCIDKQLNEVQVQTNEDMRTMWVDIYGESICRKGSHIKTQAEQCGIEEKRPDLKPSQAPKAKSMSRRYSIESNTNMLNSPSKDTLTADKAESEASLLSKMSQVNLEVAAVLQSKKDLERKVKHAEMELREQEAHTRRQATLNRKLHQELVQRQKESAVKLRLLGEELIQQQKEHDAKVQQIEAMEKRHTIVREEIEKQEATVQNLVSQNRSLMEENVRINEELNSQLDARKDILGTLSSIFEKEGDIIAIQDECIYELIERELEQGVLSVRKAKERFIRQSASQQASASLTSDCVICMENPKALLLQPCKHFCLCFACSLKIERCPLCQTKIQSTERIYSS